MMFLVFLDHHLGKLLFAAGAALVILCFFIDTWQANYFRCRFIEAHLKAGGKLEDEDEEPDEG